MMLITVVTASEGLIVSGFATFMPKFFQEMYNLSAGSAAALSGTILVTEADPDWRSVGICLKTHCNSMLRGTYL